MKYIYAIALFLVVLMVGCSKSETPPAAPAAPPAAPTAPAAPAAPTAPAASEAPTAPAAPVVSDADQATIARLKTACERGNAGLCAALKNQYNIDWSPAAAAKETPAASETAATGTTA